MPLETLSKSNRNTVDVVQTWDERFGPLLAFVITFATFLPFSRLGLDIHHDGIMLKPALDVSRGKLLFLETFTQYGALTTYIHATALSLLNERVLALRWITVLFYAGASSFLVAVWRRFLPWRLVRWSYVAWLAMAPFYSRAWTMAPWSSVIALFFQVGALYFLVRALERRRMASAFLCGAFSAATFWARLPVGLLLSGALIVAFYLGGRLFKKAKARFLGLSAVLGALVVHGVFIGRLLVTGAFQQWYFQNWVWPMTWAGGKSAGLTQLIFPLLVYRSPFFSSHSGPYRIAALLAFAGAFFHPFLSKEKGHRFYLRQLLLVFFSAALEWEFFRSIEAWAILFPWIVLGSLIIMIKSGISKDPFSSNDPLLAPAIGAGFVAIASWAQYYPIPCHRHLFWALSPSLGLCLACLVRLFPRAIVGNISGGLFLLLTPLLLSKGWQARLFLQEASQPLSIPNLHGMYVTPDEATRLEEAYARLSEVLNRVPAPPLIIEGPDAFWSSWTKSPLNPSAYYIVWPGLPLGDRERDAKADFIERHTPVVLVSTLYGTEFTHRLVKEYEARGYHTAFSLVGVGSILMRRVSDNPRPQK